MVEDYKAYYDTIASVFDRLRLDRGAEIETTLRLIAQFVNSEDGYILDIGCGTGRYAEPLGKAGYSVLGIDQSLSQLKHGPDSLPLICADAAAPPFRDHFFAACLMILVIHQVTSSERRKWLEESCRILSPTGKLILKTCSHDNLRNRPFHSFFPSGLKINVQRYPDIPELSDQIRACGFGNIEVVPTFSEEFLNKADLLSSMRQKHNTTLALIPPEELEKGCIEMESAVANQDVICIPHHHTVLIAQK